MKSWRFTGTNEPLQLAELPEPTAGPGQVVVDVKAAGICHTDVGILTDPGWMTMLRAPAIPPLAIAVLPWAKAATSRTAGEISDRGLVNGTTISGPASPIRARVGPKTTPPVAKAVWPPAVDRPMFDAWLERLSMELTTARMFASHLVAVS